MSTFWVVLAALNVATMLAYGCDKFAAKTGGRRVRESSLHILAAAGGTPGAFAAQLLFRHKTRDRRFRRVFWATVFLQVVVLLAVACMRQGWLLQHAKDRKAGREQQEARTLCESMAQPQDPATQ